MIITVHRRLNRHDHHQYHDKTKTKTTINTTTPETNTNTPPYHLTTSIVITVTATSTVESIILRPEGNNTGQREARRTLWEAGSPLALDLTPIACSPGFTQTLYSDLIAMSVGLMIAR